MTTKLFKPLEYTKKYKIRRRIKYGRKYEISYLCDRISYKGPVMTKIFSKLHYLGSHQPKYSKKWAAVEQKFLRQHMRREF